jgi:hypothetical protein
MYSNENSLSNSMIKVFGDRHHSTVTTSDDGESLCDDDLEWDKSDFTRHLPESDALSSYDVNEMTEILRNRFLEFDMSSQIDGLSILSRQSTLTERFIPISTQDLTIKKSLSSHRSLSNLNLSKQRCFLLSKHFSLMDIKSIEWTFSKHPKAREITLRKANSCISVCSMPQSMEIESQSLLFNTITNRNFSRLSKFATIRLYVMKFQDKLSSLVYQTFQSREISFVTQDILDSYEIIERQFYEKENRFSFSSY